MERASILPFRDKNKQTIVDSLVLNFFFKKIESGKEKKVIIAHDFYRKFSNATEEDNERIKMKTLLSHIKECSTNRSKDIFRKNECCCGMRHSVAVQLKTENKI